MSEPTQQPSLTDAGIATRISQIALGDAPGPIRDGGGAPPAEVYAALPRNPRPPDPR